MEIKTFKQWLREKHNGSILEKFCKNRVEKVAKENNTKVVGEVKFIIIDKTLLKITAIFENKTKYVETLDIGGLFYKPYNIKF